jgi:transcriptional regulator with XRE-family HTH domain
LQLTKNKGNYSASKKYFFGNQKKHYLCSPINSLHMKGYYGDGIYHFRNLRKQKQEWLASWLNMSRQNLSEIERNKRMVSDELLALAAEKLDTTPEEIKNFKFNEDGAIFNNQHQQGEQYNNCVVSVPQALLDALQTALKSNQIALENTNKQIEIFKIEFESAKKREESMLALIKSLSQG